MNNYNFNICDRSAYLAMQKKEKKGGDKMNQQIKIGQGIIFFDESKIYHDALVTFVHSETCINLLIVSKNPAEQDGYGRQIKRYSSVVHRINNDAGGYCWCFPQEI